MVTNSPFTAVNAINLGQNWIRNDTYPDQAEKDYNPYIVNKAFSNYMESVMYANDMNINCHLDKLLQFEYLLETIRPRKRKRLWHKSEKSPDHVKEIANFYNINIQRAREYCALMSDNEIEKIIRKGGKE